MIFLPRIQDLSILAQLEVFNFHSFVFLHLAMIKLATPLLKIPVASLKRICVIIQTRFNQQTFC